MIASIYSVTIFGLHESSTEVTHETPRVLITYVEDCVTAVAYPSELQFTIDMKPGGGDHDMAPLCFWILRVLGLDAEDLNAVSGKVAGLLGLASGHPIRWKAVD